MGPQSISIFLSPIAAPHQATQAYFGSSAACQAALSTRSSFKFPKVKMALVEWHLWICSCTLSPPLSNPSTETISSYESNDTLTLTYSSTTDGSKTAASSPTTNAPFESVRGSQPGREDHESLPSGAAAAIGAVGGIFLILLILLPLYNLMLIFVGLQTQEPLLI